MKLPALAIAAFTVAAFVGGTAAAQMAPAVTMQPIPNPPESGASHGTMHHHMRHGRHHMHHHMHHHMTHHHMMKKSSKMAAPTDSTPPAPTPDAAAPPSPQ